MSHYPVKSHHQPFHTFKWAFRLKDLISFVGVTSILSLIIHLNYEDTPQTQTILQQQQQTNNNPHKYTNPRSIIALLHTPETGSETLTPAFLDSFHCNNSPSPPPNNNNNNNNNDGCTDERMVVEAHDAIRGAAVIQQYQHNHPGGSCLVATANRSPATWLPSLYINNRSSQLCHHHQASSSTTMIHDEEEILRDYQQFLANVDAIRQAAEPNLPTLLHSYPTDNLVGLMETMEFVGGYAVLGPAPLDSQFAGCDLLVLRMEERSDRWKDVLGRLVPGTHYNDDEGGDGGGEESHLKRSCPGLSWEHSQMLYEYQLTRDEKMTLYTQGGDLLPDWFDAYEYITDEERDHYSPPIIQEPSYNDRKDYNTPQSVIAMINTPKTGTEGLTQNFYRFWKCKKEIENPFCYTYKCPDDRKVIRAHQYAAGTQALQHHRQNHPGGQCLIVTSIRHPATWFPSLYAQKTKICEKNSNTMSKEDMLNDYKRFLGDEHLIVLSAEIALPGLMEEFPFGSLQQQAEIMVRNGGYSVLTPTSPDDSVFAGCELLFLRIEQSDEWPTIIQRMMPELRYERTKSQSSRCPELAGHVRMLKEYELTAEEKRRISTYGSGLLKDWFDTYDYI